MMHFITWQSSDRMPLWNCAFSIACEAVSSPIEIARIVRSFIKKRGVRSINISVWLQLYGLLFDPAPPGMRRQAKMHSNDPTNAEIRSSN